MSFNPMTIRDLPEGELITEAGFYRMPIEVHHSQCTDGISITSSVLRKMELGCPSYVWDFHDLNPNKIVRPQTDALRMGRAMASFIEGGIEEVEKYFRAVPNDRPRRPTADQVAAIKMAKGTPAGLRSYTFWKSVDEDERDIITEDEWNTISEMGRVLAADPAACSALTGEPEITMAWRDEQTDIWCLARPDLLSFSGLLTDYKKMTTKGGYFSGSMVDKRITQHGYDMQMAFAAEGFTQLTGELPDMVGLVCQCEEAPHYVIPRGFEADDLEIGQFRNRRALNLFRECYDTGHWPTPGEHVANYRRPEHMRDRLIEEMREAGETF